MSYQYISGITVDLPNLFTWDDIYYPDGNVELTPSYDVRLTTFTNLSSILSADLTTEALSMFTSGSTVWCLFTGHFEEEEDTPVANVWAIKEHWTNYPFGKYNIINHPEAGNKCLNNLSAASSFIWLDFSDNSVSKEIYKASFFIPPDKIWVNTKDFVSNMGVEEDVPATYEYYYLNSQKDNKDNPINPERFGNIQYNITPATFEIYDADALNGYAFLTYIPGHKPYQIDVTQISNICLTGGFWTGIFTTAPNDISKSTFLYDKNWESLHDSDCPITVSEKYIPTFLKSDSLGHPYDVPWGKYSAWDYSTKQFDPNLYFYVLPKEPAPSLPPKDFEKTGSLYIFPYVYNNTDSLIDPVSNFTIWHPSRVFIKNTITHFGNPSSFIKLSFINKYEYEYLNAELSPEKTWIFKNSYYLPTIISFDFEQYGSDSTSEDVAFLSFLSGELCDALTYKPNINANNLRKAWVLCPNNSWGGESEFPPTVSFCNTENTNYPFGKYCIPNIGIKNPPEELTIDNSILSESNEENIWVTNSDGISPYMLVVPSKIHINFKGLRKLGWDPGESEDGSSDWENGNYLNIDEYLIEIMPKFMFYSDTGGNVYQYNAPFYNIGFGDMTTTYQGSMYWLLTYFAEPAFLPSSNIIQNINGNVGNWAVIAVNNMDDVYCAAKFTKDGVDYENISVVTPSFIKIDNLEYSEFSPYGRYALIDDNEIYFDVTPHIKQ